MQIAHCGWPSAPLDTPTKSWVSRTPAGRTATIHLPPGFVVALHTHDALEVFVIVEGAASILSEPDERDVARGDVVVFQPGEQHGIVSGPHGVLLVAVVAPDDLDQAK